MRKENVVWYSTGEGDCRHSCETMWEINQAPCDIPGLEDNGKSGHKYAAQDCADDYHNNHDGWEGSWPITLILYASEDGPEVDRFNVDRESEPVFYARAVKS